MGATLSVVNDYERPNGCAINVWTVGHGFVVNGGYIVRGETIRMSLGRVWYDVDFQFNDNVFVTQRWVPSSMIPFQ